LTWNTRDGIDALDALTQIQSRSTTVLGAPPPPPPLPNFDLLGGQPAPPLPQSADVAASKAPASGDMSSVFEQLNQGSAITSKLRKVDKSEMTHKNRASSVVPERSNSHASVASSTSRGKSPIPSKKPNPESMRAKKQPRKQLHGNKWFIEHYENSGEIIELSTKLSHSVLISRCNKSIVKVDNKANAISIDNCTDLSIIVDSLVSSLEVIKASKFALQVDGIVPTVVLDQVDGATIYLGDASSETEIFTSKCSSVNIVLPPKDGADEDDKECPLPEQIRSFIKDGVVVSEVVEHIG